MTDTNGNPPVTEFSDAWTNFENRLSEFLAILAEPTINGLAQLHAPSPAGDPRIISLEARMFAEIGVDIRVMRQRSQFYPLTEGADAMPDAAREICRVFRDEWEIAHPSMLTAEGDGFVRDIAARLGLNEPAQVPDEAVEHEKLRRPARQIARRGDADVSHLTNQGDGFPDVIFPLSSDHLRSLIETTLDKHLHRHSRDEDGDYLVDGAIIGGTRLYLSVLADRPLIRLWKVVVSDVKSRQSAVIEANYLNRTHPLTKWILLGHSLVQEKFISSVPFVPDRLIEELNDFDEQYDDNRSQLLLRLGGND